MPQEVVVNREGLLYGPLSHKFGNFPPDVLHFRGRDLGMYDAWVGASDPYAQPRLSGDTWTQPHQHPYQLEHSGCDSPPLTA